MLRTEFIFRLLLLTFAVTLLGIPAKALIKLSSRHDLPKGVVLKNNEEYDYIVVGAGGGGAAAAARLSLSGASVLLVEAGGDPDILSWIPGAAPALLGSFTDWHYETVPNNQSCLSFQGEQCRASRGKCLGGSTSINYMLYTRGHPHDWDVLDIPGWTWEDMKPYFLRYEGLQNLNYLPVSSIPYHNTSGTMKVGFFDESENPWHANIKEGFLSLNFPYNSDVNGISQIGITQTVGYVHDGERMSTARGYLSRDDVKKSLKIAKNTRCTKVILDSDHVAKGVTIVTALKRTLNIYARKEVILSAGAYGTPQILMLSGIGNSDHLNDMKIPVAVDLPVGDEMTDHILPLIFLKIDSEDRPVKILTSLVDTLDSATEYIIEKAGPLASIDVTDVNAFANTKCYDKTNRQLINNSTDCELPTMQVIHSLIPKGIFTVAALVQQGLNVKLDVLKQLAAINAGHNLMIMSPIVLQPESVGNVRLASTDPFDIPAIFPNILSNDLDLEEMLRAISIIEDLVETRPFKRHNAEISRLKLDGCPDGDDEGYWRCYVRHMTQSIYHAVGTTAIGRVVDEKLRVYGVEGLRVADLGVLPRLVRGNTAASAIAVGERVADFILGGDD